MHKGRLEAFSDAVIAIALTIMVLELRVPSGHGPSDLLQVGPVFLSYFLSFVYLAIYWNNHHHMLQSVRHVSGGVLWANMHLLFWLSLVPFTTAWMGESHFSPWPVATYGLVLLGASIAYFVLALSLVKANGKESDVATALGRDLKGKASTAIYAVALPLAFVSTAVAGALYVAVALMWLLPDRRFERSPDGRFST